MQIDDYKKLKSGNAEPMLNLMRDENEGKYMGGKREDTCDHGLSRSSLRVNPLTS